MDKNFGKIPNSLDIVLRTTASHTIPDPNHVCHCIKTFISKSGILDVLKGPCCEIGWSFVTDTKGLSLDV